MEKMMLDTSTAAKIVTEDDVIKYILEYTFNNGKYTSHSDYNHLVCSDIFFWKYKYADSTTTFLAPQFTTYGDAGILVNGWAEDYTSVTIHYPKNREKYAYSLNGRYIYSSTDLEVPAVSVTVLKSDGNVSFFSCKGSNNSMYGGGTIQGAQVDMSIIKAIIGNSQTKIYCKKKLILSPALTTMKNVYIGAPESYIYTPTIEYTGTVSQFKNISLSKVSVKSSLTVQCTDGKLSLTNNGVVDV